MAQSTIREVAEQAYKEENLPWSVSDIADLLRRLELKVPQDARARYAEGRHHPRVTEEGSPGIPPPPENRRLGIKLCPPSPAHL